MTGKPTPLGQLCLAIDAMVADHKTREQIIVEVEQYYTKLQMAALEQGVTMRFLVGPHQEICAKMDGLAHTLQHEGYSLEIQDLMNRVCDAIADTPKTESTK